MWTVEGQRRWFTHCDQCSHWRFVGWYYEVYPPLHSDGEAAGWWYACADCLVNTLSDRLDKENEPAHAPWGEYRENGQWVHYRRGMHDATQHVEGIWPAHKCELCRSMAEASKREEPTT